MGADEMLRASARVMASADGTAWSQAASHQAKALYSQGRITDALAMFEQAWQRADRLDDPVAGALAACMGGGCCATLYDYSHAEEWYLREYERRRSRLIPNARAALADLLASARASMGDLPGAREVLEEFEGAAARHFLLVYHEGDWERAVFLLRGELEQARASGQVLAIADCCSILGRFARVANRRAEAEEYLNEGLRAALAGPDMNRELFIRIELALVHVDLGRIESARGELERCRPILDNGEDWRGHKGAYAHTAALVSGAEHIFSLKNSNERWHVPIDRGVQLPKEVTEGFRSSISIYQHYRSPWEEAASLLYWSQLLFAASQIRESVEKFNAAFDIFDRIAPRQWSKRLQTEVLRFVTIDANPQRDGAAATARANVFRKEGEYWTISFQGAMFRMRDTIGMHYLGRLLAHPGVEFSAEDLAAVARRARNSRRSAASIDVRADSSAGNHRDSGRERARLMVTKRIKDAIARVRQSHPDLARHLATAIRTGYTCGYHCADESQQPWLT